MKGVLQQMEPNETNEQQQTEAPQIEAETNEGAAVNRFLSPVFLGACGAFLLFVLKTWGLLTWMGLTPDSFKEGWALLLALIAAFAAANNPLSRKKF